MIAEKENIAQTLVRELPKPQVIYTQSAAGGGSVVHVVHPSAMTVTALDDEKLLANPRAINGAATFTDVESFLAYVKRNAEERSAVWVKFDPVTFALSFTAVFDEHGPSSMGGAPLSGRPGWRRHRASFTPALSKEWGIWTENNGPKQNKGQLAFAEFLEDNVDDIVSGDGLPSSIDMLDMARTFEVNADKRFKSAVRVQSGGQALEYIDTDDAGTVERMKLFERFDIGIPVFRGSKDGVRIGAKLRYRISQGAVVFWYELRRPDKAHQVAAEDLIANVKAGVENVPVFMGGIA